MKQSKFFLACLVSCLVLGTAGADPYTSAYGPQAQMSPAAMSSLSYGGAQAPAQSAAPGYTPGNGVFLTGQPAVAAPAAPVMNQAAASPYYAPQAPVAAPAYGQPFYNQAAPVSADPYAAYAGGNSYLTAKPAYGQPSHMVQRNSASYATNSFPYRNAPGVVLNPNSMTGMQSNQNINPTVAGILGGNPVQQNTAQAAPIVNSANNPNWFQKVFHRDPNQPAKPSRW